MKYTDPEGTCIACRRKGVDLHHVRTRGSGGSDESFNLMPLCRGHHVVIHNKGTKWATERLFGVLRWLRKNGWEFNYQMGKYAHKEEGGCYE